MIVRCRDRSPLAGRARPGPAPPALPVLLRARYVRVRSLARVRFWRFFLSATRTFFFLATIAGPAEKEMPTTSTRSWDMFPNMPFNSLASREHALNARAWSGNMPHDESIPELEA